MQTSETTLLSLRPSRIIVLKYYVGIVLLLILTFLLAFFSFLLPSLPIPRNTLVIGGSALFLFLAFILGIVAELKRISVKYVITDFRIIIKKGILRRDENVMPYTKLERVQLTQGILERVLGIGTVVIDTGEDQMSIASVRNPRNVEQTVMGRLQRQPR